MYVPACVRMHAHTHIYTEPPAGHISSQTLIGCELKRNVINNWKKGYLIFQPFMSNTKDFYKSSAIEKEHKKDLKHCKLRGRKKLAI